MSSCNDKECVGSFLGSLKVDYAAWNLFHSLKSIAYRNREENRIQYILGLQAPAPNIRPSQWHLS